MTKLMIVVPCYNEEEILQYSVNKLLDELEAMIREGLVSQNSGILLVNDGSSDKTWEIIEKNFTENDHIHGLSLSKNAGHQNALLAGVEVVKDFCDVSITIDADLQDDISAMRDMIKLYNDGKADIVYGVRSDRQTDSAFKRLTAQGFYKMMSFMGVDTVYNHADYRLMSSRAMGALLEYTERNMFIRGIVPKIGYDTAEVYYSRKKRTAGESKYPLKKMVSFAWDGITSLSIKPITLIMMLGLIISFLSAVAFVYVLASYFFGKTNPGWSSIMVSVWFLGGVQLFSIGVIGQYIGKSYLETKHRPRYNIKEHLTHDGENQKFL